MASIRLVVVESRGKRGRGPVSFFVPFSCRPDTDSEVPVSAAARASAKAAGDFFLNLFIDEDVDVDGDDLLLPLLLLVDKPERRLKLLANRLENWGGGVAGDAGNAGNAGDVCDVCDDDDDADGVGEGDREEEWKRE